MDLVILGGGGHASDVLSLVEARSFDGKVVVLDEGVIDRGRFAGRDVLICASSVEVEEASDLHSAEFVGGVGDPEMRRRFVEKALSWGWAPAGPLIHPSTQVTAGCSFGPGSVVLGLAWISPHVSVGRHCYVGYGTKIGHDVKIADSVSVFPGAFLAGNVRVGECSMIGANATVLPGIEIGERARVGAGAVVTTDVCAGQTVVGSPAIERVR